MGQIQLASQHNLFLARKCLSHLHTVTNADLQNIYFQLCHTDIHEDIGNQSRSSSQRKKPVVDKVPLHTHQHLNIRDMIYKEGFTIQNTFQANIIVV